MLSVAHLRKRDLNGTFLPGKIYTLEQKKEKQRIRQAKWKAKNHERSLAIAAKDRANHPERIKFHNRKDPYRSRRARRKAGERQLGRPCPPICEIPGCENTGKIHFDHCHKTGKARGWLCFNCNAALGHVRDRANVLRALADYLDAHV
jgi:hypothetical protein